MNDWENSIVIWNGDGNGGWIRAGTLLGFHGGWDYFAWGGYSEHREQVSQLPYCLLILRWPL